MGVLQTILYPRHFAERSERTIYRLFVVNGLWLLCVGQVLRVIDAGTLNPEGIGSAALALLFILLALPSPLLFFVAAVLSAVALGFGPLKLRIRAAIWWLSLLPMASDDLFGIAFVICPVIATILGIWCLRTTGVSPPSPRSGHATQG